MNWCHPNLMDRLLTTYPIQSTVSTNEKKNITTQKAINSKKQLDNRIKYHINTDLVDLIYLGMLCVWSFKKMAFFSNPSRCSKMVACKTIVSLWRYEASTHWMTHKCVYNNNDTIYMIYTNETSLEPNL